MVEAVEPAHVVALRLEWLREGRLAAARPQMRMARRLMHAFGDVVGVKGCRLRDTLFGVEFSLESFEDVRGFEFIWVRVQYDMEKGEKSQR